jgi:hypothetical protein
VVKRRSALPSGLSLVAWTIALGCASMLMAVVVQLGASAAVAAPTAGLTLKLNHGSPTDQVTATVRVTANASLCSEEDLQVTFSWDGIVVRRVDLDAACSAAARFRPPPRSRDPGKHVVRAEIENMSTVFIAGYTIDSMSGGEPDELPGGEPSEAPSASPQDGTAPSPADDSVHGAQAPSQVAGAGIGAGGPVEPSQAVNALADLWPYMFGGGLIVAGATMLCLVVVSARRAT